MKENTFGVALQLRRPQQSSRAKEARGSPYALWPMESRELGEKKASVALLSKGVFALRFVPGGESTLPECSSQNLVLSLV